MANDEEILEGYVVDLACLRHYPQAGLTARAHHHSRQCALMGHCVESGYGLVDGDGRMLLLEPAATPQVQAAIQASARSAGIRLRVTRHREGEEMRTTRVEES